MAIPVIGKKYISYKKVEVIVRGFDRNKDVILEPINDLAKTTFIGFGEHDELINPKHKVGYFVLPNSLFRDLFRRND